jgi:hypothetical protein
MHRSLFITALLTAMVSSPACGADLPRIALGPTAGTTGLGLSAAVALLPNLLNLNTGVTAWDFSDTVDVDGTPYEAKFRLGAIPIYLTIYPFGGWFNLQAGLDIPATRGRVTANIPGAGTVTGATHFNSVAPYLGVGFGQPFQNSRLTFTGNLGVMFEGPPRVTLTAANPAQTPGAAAQIQNEQDTINSKAQIAQFFPVVNLGMLYRF